MKGTFILRAAGIYNLVYCLLLAFYPSQMFRWWGMPETPLVIIQCIGMMVGVFGLGYWIAGSDPVRYWPLVAVGIVGKTLGPIGFAIGLLHGVFAWRGAPMIVMNDLIWLLPFWVIMVRAWRTEPPALRRTLL